MYTYNTEDSAEAAYSALQAAIIFYEGLRRRSRINVDVLTELKGIKDSMRHTLVDSRASQGISKASLDSISLSLRRLISSLHGSSSRSTSVYSGQAHPSNDINDQLVQYLHIAQKWLEATKPGSDKVSSSSGEGASGSQPNYSTPHRNQLQPMDSQYYTMDYYSRL